MNDHKPRTWFANAFLMSMLPTFMGVLLAFWLSEWASERNFKTQERHLLEEIQHELELNLKDLNENFNGHEKGLIATKTLQRKLSDGSSNIDSLPWYYMDALRDFISVQHTAAYETLKSRGVESITNDTLRLQIADLYDFEFETIEKVEEKYAPHEFFAHYNEPFLRIFSKCYDFSSSEDEMANRTIMSLSKLPKEEINQLNARLMKLKYDRLFSMEVYSGVIKKVERVVKAIRKELNS